jgi:hypothetical protein
MNDTELDELLNSWKTPPVPASLRERVQAGIPAKHTWQLWKLFPRWRWLVAGTAVAAGVVLLANTSAFSQKTRRPPYTVESEIISNVGLAPGCATCWMSQAYPGPKRTRMTSYNDAGDEVLLTWSAPDQPIEAEFWSAKLAVGRAIDKVMRLVPLEPELEPPDYYAGVYTTVNERFGLGGREKLVNSGCRPSSQTGEVIGEEVILNYSTVVSRIDGWKSRTFLWMAPELSCFALRARVELDLPDRGWTLMREKTAIKVTVNQKP